MNKLAYSALIASVAAHSEHRINPFAVENFMNRNLLSSLIKTATMDTPNDIGVAHFTQCDDDAGAFTLDTKSTTEQPNPITKGQDVKLMLRGIVSEFMEVEDIHVHVNWNGATLYDEDIQGVHDYTTSYSMDVAWNVPSYAPSGAYDVTLTGTGKTDDLPSGKVLCVNAKFNL